MSDEGKPMDVLVRFWRVATELPRVENVGRLHWLQRFALKGSAALLVFVALAWPLVLIDTHTAAPVSMDPHIVTTLADLVLLQLLLNFLPYFRRMLALLINPGAVEDLPAPSGVVGWMAYLYQIVFANLITLAAQVALRACGYDNTLCRLIPALAVGFIAILFLPQYLYLMQCFKDGLTALRRGRTR